MSTNIKQSVRCPKCEHMSDVTVWTTITVGDSPDLKSDLLKGSINMFCCPSCGARMLMPDPMLYHDEDRKLMFLFSPTDDPVKKQQMYDKARETSRKSGELDSVKGYNLRFIPEYNELLEKILIFDNDLSDKAVEVIKLMILSQDTDRADRLVCRFGKLEGGSLEFMVYDTIEKMTYTSAVPLETYSTVYGALIESGMKPYSFDWEMVDGVYATKLLSGFNN